MDSSFEKLSALGFLPDKLPGGSVERGVCEAQSETKTSASGRRVEPFKSESVVQLTKPRTPPLEKDCLQ